MSIRFKKHFNNFKMIARAANNFTTSDEENNIKFNDIFELEEIQHLQDLFSDSTGVASLITHPDGKPITKPSNFCRLCNDIIRKTEKGRLNCLKSDVELGRLSSSGPVIEKCLSCGLWDACLNITVNGKHMANWFIGQVRNEELDKSELINYAIEIEADKAEFTAALSEVPIVSIEKFKKDIRMLSAFANELSAKAYTNLQLKKQITEREKATESLTESEKKYRVLFESLTQGVIYQDASGAVIAANNSAERIFGLTLDQMQGRASIDRRRKTIHIDGSDFPFDMHPSSEALRTGKEQRNTIMGILNPEANTYSWININAVPQFLPGDIRPYKVITTFEDVSERKQALDELRLSEERFRSAFQNSAIGMALVSPLGVFIKVNSCFCLMLGYSENELLALTLRGITHPGDLDTDMVFKRHMLEGVINTYQMEKRYFHKSGNIVWAKLSASVVKDIDGAPLYFISQMEDITERKLAEQSVRQTTETLAFLAQYSKSGNSENFFESLARYLAGALDADFVCIDSLEGDGLNAQTLAVWHHGSFEDNVVYALKDTPCGDVVGKTICCFPSCVTKYFPRDTVLQDLKAESYIGATLWSYSGKPIGLIAVIKQQPLEYPQQAEDLLKLVAVRAAGELERIVAEEALARQVQFTQNILNTTPGFLLFKDTDGIYREVNQSFCDFLNKPKSDIIGKTDYQLFPHDEACVFTEGDQEIIRTGKRENKDWVITGASEKRWLNIVKTLVKDADGKHSGILCSVNDVTARKQAEAEINILNDELEKRVKQRTLQLENANNELEAFAYSVAHNLRSPLRGIDGWSMALLEEYNNRLDDQGLIYLNRVRNQAQQMGELIDDLLKLSRVTRLEMQYNEVDLTGIAKALVTQLSEVNPGRQFDLKIEDGLSVPGDESMLQIALTNLLENAFKFTKPKPLSQIEFGRLNANGSPAFYIRDNGVGFIQENSKNIFGAFQRMHKQSDFPGTGIGLAIVDRVISRHGGHIWAESKPGEGATFYFTINQPLTVESVVTI